MSHYYVIINNIISNVYLINSDGVGRTGTYCLLDMVLNRMNKGNNANNKV